MLNTVVTISPTLATIISALIAAFVGSFMGHILTKSRELKKARYESALKHLQAQIEEFYGPLMGLIEESNTLYTVACEILPTKETAHGTKRIDMEKFYGGDIKKWRFFIEEYWFPINKKIIELIRTKIYLLEEKELPESYHAFLKHAAGFEALHRLWKEVGESTDKMVKGVGWPEQFNTDVYQSLVRLKECYQKCLEKLGK
jgi:hypothetical protein